MTFRKTGLGQSLGIVVPEPITRDVHEAPEARTPPRAPEPRHDVETEVATETEAAKAKPKAQG